MKENEKGVKGIKATQIKELPFSSFRHKCTKHTKKCLYENLWSFLQPLLFCYSLNKTCISCCCHYTTAYVIPIEQFVWKWGEKKSKTLFLYGLHDVWLRFSGEKKGRFLHIIVNKVKTLAWKCFLPFKPKLIQPFNKTLNNSIFTANLR